MIKTISGIRKGISIIIWHVDSDYGSLPPAAMDPFIDFSICEASVEYYAWTQAELVPGW